MRRLCVCVSDSLHSLCVGYLVSSVCPVVCTAYVPDSFKSEISEAQIKKFYAFNYQHVITSFNAIDSDPSVSK